MSSDSSSSDDSVSAIRNEESIRKSLKKSKQKHLLDWEDDLDGSERVELYKQIERLPIDKAVQILRESKKKEKDMKAGKVKNKIKPLKSESLSSLSEKKVAALWKKGLEAIGAGAVAALVLAGGQGTRLGFDWPKGMYDIGLPSGKTLFEIQASRILRLQQLAKEAGGKVNVIPWYIMTSPATYGDTVQYLKDSKYLGLDKKQIIVFNQAQLPVFEIDSEKVLLSEPGKVAESPNGNGGIYAALHDEKILADAQRRGVKYWQAYSVDNVLAKVADPLFMGYCISKRLDAGAKAVEKRNWEEKIGVFAKVNGGIEVVEYTELIDAVGDDAKKVKKNGSLLYGSGNICYHFYSTKFLARIKEAPLYHIARKKVPYVDDDGDSVTPDENNAIKLESFIFDVFSKAKKFACLNVPRDSEFSPVKNPPEPGLDDSPLTALADMALLHARYIENAGGKVNIKKIKKHPEDEIVEVLPEVSYAGEGLEPLVKGQKFFAFDIVGDDGASSSDDSSDDSSDGSSDDSDDDSDDDSSESSD